MREVGCDKWVIRPLLTLECTRDMIREFEKMWVRILNGDLNTYSPICTSEERMERDRVYMPKFRQLNKDNKRYFCEICKKALCSNCDLERHTESKSHFNELMYGLE